MSWGQPHRGVLVERDGAGEIAAVRLLRRRDAPDPERRSFYCSGQVWYDLLDLGRKHGWRPLGSAPADEALQAWAREPGADNGFEPRLRPYLKQFRVEDALGLAVALERALADPVEMAMLRVTLGPASEATGPIRPLSPEMLRDFIAFLRKGPFVFAWRDF
jgi:hypothetical protein